MLKQRIVTAVALVSLLVMTLLFLPPVFFISLCLLIVVVGAWEWSGLAQISRPWVKSVYAAACALCFLLVVISSGIDSALPRLITFNDTDFLMRLVFNLSIVFWLFALIAVLRFPQVSIMLSSQLGVISLGLVLLTSAGVALIYLYAKPQGTIWVLFSVSIVAAADVGAYFVGRAFGRRKLAAQVSPGKSWEGFGGGFLLAQGTALLFYPFFSDAQVDAREGFTLWLFLFVAGVLSSVSVLGDLFESLLKRLAGVKDSGTILPGHGGVLDRIDGLLAAVPVLAFFCILFRW